MDEADPVGATTINHDAILMMLRHLSPQQAVLAFPVPFPGPSTGRWWPATTTTGSCS